MKTIKCVKHQFSVLKKTYIYGNKRIEWFISKRLGLMTAQLRITDQLQLKLTPLWMLTFILQFYCGLVV